MVEQWVLSAELAGHEDDVRSVYSRKPDELLSASRDKTLRSWNLVTSEGHPTWEAGPMFVGHKSFVSAVSAIPPSEKFPQGLIVSSGYDKEVKVHDPENPMEPLTVLQGHTENVCCLHIAKNGNIISGSWDKTAIVWKDFRLSYAMTKHEQAVWGVLGLDDGRVLTASADKLIRLWNGRSLVKEIRGHTDVVRGLVDVPEHGGFASCSNDATVRVWTYEGDPLFEVHGHTNFIYGIARIPDSHYFITCSEDRTVRIWKDTECIQTIALPVATIWSVCPVANGDIAVGTCDGLIRIFSRDPARHAKPETIAAFDAEVAKFKMNTKQMGDIDVSKLPGIERLYQPGKQDGQTIMVKVGTKVEAHQWSSAQQAWSKVGDVVDAVGSNRQQIYEGKEYDYVFEVDIADDQPKLKLPYNVSENPYTAAQRFIQNNGLPISYIDQVAAFIVQNTKGVSIGQEAPQASDPWTGESRYTPGSSTGRNASSAASQTIFPMRDFVTFKQANVPMILKKIKEFNQQFEDEVRLDNQAIAKLEHICEKMTSHEPPDGIWEVLAKALLAWPIDQQFPVLDLIRVSSLKSPIVRKALLTATESGESHLQRFSIVHTGNKKTDEVMAMLGFRTFANIVVAEEVKATVMEKRHEFIEAASTLHASTNQNLILAILTVYLNVSIALGSADVSFGFTIFDFVITTIQKASSDENIYRSLALLGNLISLNHIEKAHIKERVSSTLRMKSFEPRHRPLVDAVETLLA